MNYEYVEKLANAAKSGNTKAKDELIIEFTPIINSISRKTFIDGYDYSDIRNECFITLFTCLSKYEPDSNRFAAYAMNAMKRNINFLLRNFLSKADTDSSSILSLDDNLEHYISSHTKPLDEDLCLLCDYEELISVIKTKLNDEEKDLILFLYFKQNTLVNYAYYKNISYVAASKRKKKVLSKLKSYIGLEVMNCGN